LLALEPRVAGTEVIDPAGCFAESEDSLHDSARCPVSKVCMDHTDICTTTG
jgi:hypothetical protein